VTAAVALAPGSSRSRRPTQVDELDRLARHDHVFGRHSALTRLGQAFARLLSDWAENGQVTAYAWQLCEGLGRSGGKLRYSRRSWFRARTELLHNGCMTEQLPDRLPNGKYGAAPTFVIHFGPDARRIPGMSSRHLRAVVDQAQREDGSLDSESNRVPIQHGSGSLESQILQEITEAPSHPAAPAPTDSPPSPNSPTPPDPAVGTGETIGTPSPEATADPSAPPLTPPHGGGEESAIRNVLHVACRIVMQAPDSPRRDRFRSPGRVRGELQRLAQALLARDASLELVIHAARQYAAEDGPWCYWRNLAPGITQICEDVRAWSPPAEHPSPNPRRGVTATLAAALDGAKSSAESSSSSTRPTTLTTSSANEPLRKLGANDPSSPASSSSRLEPAAKPTPPASATPPPRTAQERSAPLPGHPVAPEPPHRSGDDLPGWLRDFREALRSSAKKPDKS
jgi:hypothetical protein